MPEEEDSAEKCSREGAKPLFKEKIAENGSVGHTHRSHQHYLALSSVDDEKSDEESRARRERKDESCAELIDHNIRFHHLARTDKRRVVDIEGEGVVMVIGIIPRNALGGEARLGEPLLGVTLDLIKLEFTNPDRVRAAYVDGYVYITSDNDFKVLNLIES